MDSKHLQTLLDVVGATKNDQGWWEAPEGRSFTLYAAHGAVPLSIAKATALRLEGPLAQIKTGKGETFFVLVEDLFAGSVEGTSSTGRKAGFI